MIFFKLQGFDDATYREVNRNWADAKAFCEEKAEGTLATANDEATRTFLHNYQDHDPKR